MDELTTKRLAIIKQLYKLGVNQSYDSEPMNGFCLLSFHDSVEMFMKLCAETRGVKITRDVNFGDYFTKVSDLQCQTTMANLNNKRVALKHYGALPSKLDVEISRVNVTDFFIQNTLLFFGTDFDDISLVSLIKSETVRSYLKLSIKGINESNYETAIINSQIAFKELISCYEEEKRLHWSSPFEICEDFAFCGSQSLKQIGLGKEFDNFTEKVQKSLSNLNDVSKILGFGIDFKKYCKFKILEPYINVWIEKNGRKYEAMTNERTNYNKRNAEFCFDFVVDSALKLQEFDF